ERDHYGLEKVKDRVLEYLAVRKLKAERAKRGEIPPDEVNSGPRPGPVPEAKPRGSGAWL
ncbi:hypothetical protein, partial [Thermus scotoductus]|uniref:hypothetical protein n=1 Tax=Thermus scotoductus TaxID=37636 RepID=UPI0015627400